MDNFNELFSSLTQRVGQILPGIAGAIVVLVVGLIIAWSVKKLILHLFKKVNVDEKINAKFSSNFKLDEFVARLGYFLVLIYMLLVVLDMLGIKGVLEPLSNMLSEFLGFLPNIVAAGIIGFAGYVIATLASEATGFVALTLQDVSKKAGLEGSLSIGSIVKQVVFIFVFIPILIAALDALQMNVIADPAKEMFSNFLNAIPKILAGAVILGVFYIVGKYIVSLLVELLHNLGTDNLSNSLELGDFGNAERPLSGMIGKVAFFFIMFGGIIAAMEKIDLPQFTNVLNEVFDIAGRIFFGLVILFLGNYLSNIAKKSIAQSEDSEWLGSLAKFAVLFIFLALGLNTMGIGEEIVNLAFGLTVGALAVAFALSFGLGGREAAGKYMDKFLGKLDKK